MALSARPFQSILRALASLCSNPRDLLKTPAWIYSVVSKHLGATATESVRVTRPVPWLPYTVIRVLEERLKPNMTVFEFGAGSSTLWFAQRARSVVSVEHDARWYNRVQQLLREAGVNNCTLLLCEPQFGTVHRNGDLPDGVDYSSYETEGSFEAYVKTIRQYPDEGFDMVLVDGRCRPACLLHAMPKVRPGGLLILDNSDRENYRERYRSAMKLVPWPRQDYRGITPFLVAPVRTTIWTRPLSSSRDRMPTFVP